MITSEFKSAISGGSLLRARIMLKDSLVIDPTFSQFDEMLAYAKKMRPEIVAPFDSSMLEGDSAKWTRDLMNLELVQLVDNFSDFRIDHLKKVISQVMAEEIKRIRTPKGAASKLHATRYAGSVSDTQPDEKRARGYALRRIREQGEEIGRIMDKVDQQGRKWSPEQVAQMKRCAQNILEAVEEYETTRRSY